MELTLTHTGEQQQVAVDINGRFSHHFSLSALPPLEKDPTGTPRPPRNPKVYGRALYHALFPTASPAANALANRP
jgi:hypothetical protein